MDKEFIVKKVHHAAEIETALNTMHERGYHSIYTTQTNDNAVLIFFQKNKSTPSYQDYIITLIKARFDYADCLPVEVRRIIDKIAEESV